MDGGSEHNPRRKRFCLASDEFLPSFRFQCCLGWTRRLSGAISSFCLIFYICSYASNIVRYPSATTHFSLLPLITLWLRCEYHTHTLHLPHHDEWVD
ncbi:hypothetical protein BT69DRAFT_443392 [Atractiella rhizophila]|nr:hypothetical protein BT69DRAFT_443392 [Atractiella rhizophila]